MQIWLYHLASSPCGELHELARGPTVFKLHSYYKAHLATSLAKTLSTEPTTSKRERDQAEAKEPPKKQESGLKCSYARL